MSLNKKSLLFLALATLQLSCSDRSLDDWKKEELARDASKLNQIVGVYTGVLVSEKDSKNLGLVGIKFEKDTLVSDLNDRSAALKATLLFKNEEPVYTPFRNVYFDPDSGAFDGSADVSFLDGTERKDQLRLVGKVEAGVVKGELGLLSYPNNIATFDLQKSPETSTEKALLTPAEVEIDQQQSIKKSYWGIMKFAGTNEETKAELLLSDSLSSAGLRFLNLLSPLQAIRATVYNHWNSGPPLEITFNTAAWNRENNYLKAFGGQGDGWVSLDCRPTPNPNNPAQPGLKCDYMTARRGYTAELTVFPQ